MSEYSVLRNKDAKIAKLIGKEVKVLPGYWDPESDQFNVHHVSLGWNSQTWQESYNILDTEKIREIQEKISEYPNFEEASDLERTKVFLLEDSAREFLDIKELPWSGEFIDLDSKNRFTSHSVDFCTPDLAFNTGKKHDWMYLPRYSSSLDDFREIEKFIIDNGLREKFVDAATLRFDKYFFMHISSEELVDFCIEFLSKEVKNA